MTTVTSRFLSHKPNQRKHQRILTSTLNIVLHVHHETHQPSLISKHTKNIRDEIFGYISESRYYSISREVCNPVNVSMSQNYITRCKYYIKCLKQSQSKNPLVTTGTRGPGNCRDIRQSRTTRLFCGVRWGALVLFVRYSWPVVLYSNMLPVQVNFSVRFGKFGILYVWSPALNCE